MSSHRLRAAARFFVLSALIAGQSAQAEAPVVKPGSLVTYNLGGQDRFCGRVTSVYADVAWVVDRERPAWTFRLQLSELTPGCAPG